MPCGKGTEVGTVRVGVDVVGDDLHPGPGDRVMVLLRSPLVRGYVPDPVADPDGGLRHAVAPHGQEGQVDVLPVPELPAGAGDLRQDRGQFGVGQTVRPAVLAWTRNILAGERDLLAGHQQTSCRAVRT